MAEEKKLTGYPSIDKPWLKYYRDNAEEIVNNIPKNKTVWDVIEEKLIEYKDIPALEYFGRKFSREEFIEMVYAWARAFRAMGVCEDEIVSVYSPFFPDICAMTLALNLIGACSYFLKLAISPEALAEETKDSKIAIVFDDMWGDVSNEFTKERFEKIIIVKATDSMTFPKKQIVSLLSKSANVPKEKRFYSAKQALALSKSFKGDVRATFLENRNAFITSSSGTTIGGVVKGTIATNESALAQLLMQEASEMQWLAGERCLTNFPPTASTALDCLFLLPLYKGMTSVIDPRVSEDDFYNQIMNLNANAVISTGSMWETFFNRISKEIANGKKFDFSYARAWTIDGEGIDCKKIRLWNEIIRSCGSNFSMFSGYGLSEVFATFSIDTVNAKSNENNSKNVTGVGIPLAGITVGIFDSQGKELPYNSRGELWAKSKSAMKGYYNKPELTNNILIDGWIHTGDLAEIDENGFVYIWGRMKDKITLNDNSDLYLFDIANWIKESPFIDDAIVLSKGSSNSKSDLVAHIVWVNNTLDKDKQAYLLQIDKAVNAKLPEGVRIIGYAEHDEMLPYSPTTLKKDKNRLSKQTAGFVQVENSGVSFII